MRRLCCSAPQQPSNITYRHAIQRVSIVLPLQRFPAIRSASQSVLLLHHVRKLMRQQLSPFLGLWRIPPLPEDGVPANCECGRTDRSGRLGCTGVSMDSHAAKIMRKTGLRVHPNRRVGRLTACAQYTALPDCRAVLHIRLWKADDETQPPLKRRIRSSLEVGREDGKPAVSLRALQQITHLDVGLMVVAVLDLTSLAEQRIGLIEQQDGATVLGCIETRGAGFSPSRRCISLRPTTGQCGRNPD
jgi:hypothetical protein